MLRIEDRLRVAMMGQLGVQIAPAEVSKIAGLIAALGRIAAGDVASLHGARRAARHALGAGHGEVHPVARDNRCRPPPASVTGPQ